MPVAEGALPEAAFDVAVVGGGINGTGVARDLALRGLSVVLFERNDIAFGASGNSSGMIHGGVRYLSKAPHVTETSCRDSGYIQRIAPHLLFRLPFVMPVATGGRQRILFELIDAYFQAYDDYQPLKRSHPHCRVDASDLARIEPGIVGSFVGGITFDEWGIDGARLCILNALDAAEHGARVHVHTDVESVRRAPDDGRERYVVDAREAMTGKQVRVRARAVVNATGAWTTITAALEGLPQSRVRVRPGKGIHIVLDRRVVNYGVLSETIDGRQIFIYPWENVSVIGTTDDDYFGDLDDVVATSEEVRYLVQGIARVFPSVRSARPIGTYAGARATLYAYGPNEDALSREHEIVDHATDGAPGVYSLVGGKLASYRLFAQEAADLVASKDFESNVPCSTHTRPLPGGASVPDAVAFAETHKVTPVTARRLVFRHGTIAERILDRAAHHPSGTDVVCPCEPVLEAEVRHVIRTEWACSVDDVSRRTRLGLGACGGMRCAARCGQILAQERGLSFGQGRAMAQAFLVRQARTRIVAMGPTQARQEALALAQMRASMGDGRW